MVVGLLVVALAAWHPIHSSLTTVEVDPTGATARLTIKVYAEDFPPGADLAKIGTYLGERLILTDPAGRVVHPALVSQRQDGPVQWIVATAALPGSRAALTMRNTLLLDRFDDQVNVVQIRRDGRVETLLFVRSSGPKPLWEARP